ncbi:VOC family protein [Streptomyces sp. NPDC048018]|uniref:VOC family protein n=1 Tax=Streptomyces sp. NPDC048018 TaxID=3365499 RepID=UPI0037117AF5
MTSQAVTGALHHVEIWVPDIGRATASFGPLLEGLGHEPFQEWERGRSWRRGATYLVFEESSALSADAHDRLRPGLNHLAFHVATRAEMDRLVEEAVRGGWRLLFPDRHPHAGGERSCAAYLENADGFELELVASEW